MKYIAVAIKGDWMTALSRPCTYSEALMFSDCTLCRGESFDVITEEKFNESKKTIR